MTKSWNGCGIQWNAGFKRSRLKMARSSMRFGWNRYRRHKRPGTWGEVQLGTMLEQILSPDQYEANVATRPGGERVEFALKLPGRGQDRDDVVWLPIDAKFPVEDYQRLVEAQENADAATAEEAARQL